MDFRIDKTAGRRVPRRRPQSAQDADALEHWLSRPPEERVAAAAFMTRRLYRLRHGRDLPPLDKSVVKRVPRTHA